MTTPAGPDVEPPSVPGVVVAVASAARQGRVELGRGDGRRWCDVVYDLERCKGSGCTNFTVLATSATTDFADTSVAAGSTYVYRVRAVDAAGNIGSFSNSADVTTPAGPDTEPPSVPGTLTATAASSSEVDLSWGAATDESAVVYDLERCKGSGCTDFTVLATSATTDFADTSVAAGSTYVYRVRAVDAAGNIGSFSNSADGDDAGGPGH